MTFGLYDVVKATHVIAVLVFVSGILLASVALRARSGAASDATILATVRRWDARVTTPAMLTTWALGFTLALMGHWLPSGWLIAKLVVVVLLSGWHGVQSGRLRKSGAAGVDAFAPAIVVTAAGLIVALVVLKPF